MKNRVTTKPVAKLNIVFFGNERLATGITTTTPILQGLLEAGHQISLVVTKVHQAQTRRENRQEIIETAKEYGLKTSTPEQLVDIKDEIRKLRPDLAVLVAFGQIVPQSIIDLFPYGIINIHPSLLPQYRGSTPIETAILDDRKYTGVTIMQLTAQLDAGPVYIQEKVNLKTNISKQSLADQLLLLGKNNLMPIIDQIVAGVARTQPQSSHGISYTKQIKKSDGKFEGSKTAQRLICELRAFAGWPGSFVEYKKKRITILEGTISDKAMPVNTLTNISGELYFGCANGSVQIKRLQPAGKKPMGAKDFINGQPELYKQKN